MNPAHETTPKVDKKRAASKLRQSFVTGLVVILPLFITVILLKLVVGWLRSGLKGTFHMIFKLILGSEIATSPYYGYLETLLLFAIGLPIVLLFILLVGWLARNYLGQRLLRSTEDLLQRVPLVGSIYDAARQLVKTVFMRSSTTYKGVVLVEFPRRELWMIGFVTTESRGEIQRRTTQTVLGVFIPTTPNPTSGFLVFVPEQDVVKLEMSVEDGLKLVISGGLVEPPGQGPPAGLPDQADRPAQDEPAVLVPDRSKAGDGS